jgi:hypothetical protein
LILVSVLAGLLSVNTGRMELSAARRVGKR